MISLHNKNLKKKIYQICKKYNLNNLDNKNISIFLNEIKEEIKILDENQILLLLNREVIFNFNCGEDSYGKIGLMNNLFQEFYKKQPKEKLMDKFTDKIHFFIKMKYNNVKIFEKS